MKKLRKRLSAILAIAMVLTCLPVPVLAGELSDADDVLVQADGLTGDEAVLTDESDRIIENEEESEGLLEEEVPKVVFNDRDNVSEGMSLKALAEQYDNDRDSTSGYKIIYVSENGVSLEDDAWERIEGTGNRNISIGEDGTVTQTFDKESEDVVAPLVYKKEGMAARGDKAWYVIYTESYSTPILNDSGEVTGYTTGTRDIRKYFSSAAKVTDKDFDKGSKTLKDYADSQGIIRMYPNWQTPVPVSFDQLSLKEAENPNSDIKDYVQYETLRLDPLNSIMGYDFKTWEYQFEGGIKKEAEEGKDELEGKFLIETENNTKPLTIYAVWEPARYKIKYVGIKVQPVSANDAGDGASKDTLYIDGAQMEVVSVDREEPVINSDSLPDFYTYDSTTVLPSASEINEGRIDKDFSEYNRFLCWSDSRKFLYNHIITALGKDGEVKYGDVTLYAVYTSKYPIPGLSANMVAADKEYKAVQETELDLLDRDSYAVISLIGTGVSADPKTAKLEGDGAKYFELCEVDTRKAVLGHGYATIGIRLKETVDGKEVDAATVAGIIKSKSFNSLIVKVQGIDHRINDKGEPVYCEIALKLKTRYKIPKYKLTATSGTLYTNYLKKDEKAQFAVSEKDGALTLETYGGVWEADYTDKNKSTYTPVDPSDVSVSVYGNDFTIEAKSVHKSGHIRLRNSSWVKGAYTYCQFKLNESNKDPGLKFTDVMIVLNTAGDKETSTVTASFKGGMDLDPSKLGYDPGKSKLAEGLSVTVDKVKGTISVTRKGEVKKGSYKLNVTYEGLKKGTNLTVKVMDTSSEKAVKLTSPKGCIDIFAGGSMYYTPRVIGFAGTIADVYVDEQDGTKSGFDAIWHGKVLELETNDDFVPFSKKASINLKVKLSTGVELPAVCKIKYKKGKLIVDVYDAGLNVDLVEGKAVETSVNTPVIVTYTYTYYPGPSSAVKKIYTIDMTREEGGKLLEVECKPDSAGLVSIGYENGVLTITNKKDIDVSKAKTISLPVKVKWKSDKQTASVNYKLKLAAAVDTSK